VADHAVLVIGVGNELRGDDGAGIEVARRLRQPAAAREGVEVREHQGEPTELLDAWQGAEAVVLVDTMRSGAPPGTIRRFDASEAPLPRGLGGATSTHAVGLIETLELARAVGRLPTRVVVYAIEGQCFEAGAPITGAVRSRVDDLAVRVLGEVRDEVAWSCDIAEVTADSPGIVPVQTGFAGQRMMDPLTGDPPPRIS
jgi:hydrogenase maturation protease